MRRKENRKKVNRLFIFGAGASYRATRRLKDSLRIAPLDAGFCSRLADLNPSKPHWVRQSRRTVTEAWLDEGAFTASGLEQAILQQLGHLEFIGAIHPRRKIGAIDSYAWLSHVTYLMCYALRHAKENSGKIYKRFSAKLHLGNFDQEAADRVVTFNYDDLLDQHLLKSYTPAQLYFDAIRSGPDDKSPITRNDYPLLVKLHGSVNWRCKEEDFEKMVKGSTTTKPPATLDPVWLSQVGTPKPTEAVYPLMVPPLPVKPITSISLFQYLWTIAYEYLNDADEIIVCGYSLPEADRMAWSLFGNFSNKTLKKVTVVDPNPDVLRKWRKLFKRKSVAVARWEYFDDFAAYVDDMA